MTPNQQQPTLHIPTRPSTPESGSSQSNPIQSSESDSDKENVQPDVLHNAEDPDVPRTASASPYKQGEIIQGTGDTRKRSPDSQERTAQHHHTSQETYTEQDIREYQRPPTPFLGQLTDAII